MPARSESSRSRCISSGSGPEREASRASGTSTPSKGRASETWTPLFDGRPDGLRRGRRTVQAAGRRGALMSLVNRSAQLLHGVPAGAKAQRRHAAAPFLPIHVERLRHRVDEIVDANTGSRSAPPAAHRRRRSARSERGRHPRPRAWTRIPWRRGSCRREATSPASRPRPGRVRRGRRVAATRGSSGPASRRACRTAR